MFDKLTASVASMRLISDGRFADEVERTFIPLHDRMLARHAEAVSANRGWDTRRQEAAAKALQETLVELRDFASAVVNGFAREIGAS